MPALQIISLDTATPRLRAPASGDTYSAPRAMELTPESLTGSAATSSLAITQTWNTTGTPTAISLNVTDTASNASSLLMDLRVGGSSRLGVRKDGQVSFSGGVAINVPGNVGLALGTDLAAIRFGASGDLFVTRDAANTLAQRNGTNAQGFNIYNTYTDASNYERGYRRWVGNVMQIGTEKAGTGTARGMEFQTDGATRMSINAVGQILVTSDFGAASTFILTAGGARQLFHNGSSLALRSTSSIISMGTDGNGANPDLDIRRVAAGVLRLSQNGTNVGGALEMIEQTAPAAPAANSVRIFAQDNGAGKTQLMALFATGAAQQIAIEP